MFQWFQSRRRASAQMAALGRSLALIEFSPDGHILWANENFCRVLGYELAEIKGKHHRIFVDPAYAESPEYRAFWTKLGRGEFEAAEYKRNAKGGREIWIQASYNPVKTSAGKVLRIIKQATDITAEKLKSVETQGIVTAISRAVAVIEFTPDGEILDANENFLNAMGYRLDEIRGRHHRMFVEPSEAQSPAYAAFWKNLRTGAFAADEYRRFGKDGREVHLMASYNPVFDMNGTIVKVIKIANNVTAHKAALVELGFGLRQLAENRIDYRITQPFIAQYESLKTDFNALVETLESMIRSIAHTSSGVTSGSREISQASDDLARRTEQQAATLEETAAALDELTASVRKTADGAKEVREVVELAKTDAAHSSEVVKETVAAMGGIESSSKQIGNIIGVIDEIAFQTNLLPLNAGVEAARAGDAGRGFAVVATEVRALAQRSADAAKEIKALISASGTQVATGVRLVGETGKALERTLGQVEQINVLVRDIAASAQEQATGLAEVNTAINQMDQGTQQNAAMVEQSTAASHALATEAAELGRLVGQFQLSHPSAGHIAKPAAAREARALPNQSDRKAPRVGVGKFVPVPMHGIAVTSQGGEWNEF
jgi:methyl-accepting chemotaxis protein